MASWSARNRKTSVWSDATFTTMAIPAASLNTTPTPSVMASYSKAITLDRCGKAVRVTTSKTAPQGWLSPIIGSKVVIANLIWWMPPATPRSTLHRPTAKPMSLAMCSLSARKLETIRSFITVVIVGRPQGIAKAYFTFIITRSSQYEANPSHCSVCLQKKSRWNAMETSYTLRQVAQTSP